jgi:hypothetical protein
MTNQVETKTAATRIYSVRNIVDGSVRLVKAQNAAQASRHVAKDTLDVTIPTTVQALDITKANPNIEVEEA